MSSGSLASGSTSANPDPSKYRLVKKEQRHGHLIVELHYDGCTNFEGHKLLVFKNTTWEKLLLRNRDRIDPHFNHSRKYQYPVARFVPNATGWKLARATAAIL
jgi:hypothetical protein